MTRAEMLGPPGVGKTTLFNRVAWGSARVTDTSDFSLPPSHVGLLEVALAVVKDLPEFARWCQSIVRSIHYDAFLQAKAGPGSWLLDEALCQNALLLHRLGAPQWRAFLERIPVAGRVVLYCSASPHEIARRGASRRRGGLSVEQAACELVGCEAIAADLESRGGRVRRLWCLDVKSLAVRVRSILGGQQ